FIPGDRRRTMTLLVIGRGWTGRADREKEKFLQASSMRPRALAGPARFRRLCGHQRAITLS
ncbi:MAG: hypothetical protein J0I75_09460, partial [Hyphomicrobium sp.]|nr:hypothetical protein [Hyphomicrobium sp.]